MGTGCLLFITVFAGIAWDGASWTEPYFANGLGPWPELIAANNTQPVSTPALSGLENCFDLLYVRAKNRYIFLYQLSGD